MVEAVAERFWTEFESEASEHLATVEASLMAFVDGKVADNVAPLFRALHSLKGLARAMGLNGMEQTAHLSESVLHFVREGKATASLDVVDALFLAHDAMLRQLTVAVSSRQDDLPAPDLVRALEEQQRRLAEQTFGDAGAAEAAEAVEHDEADEMLHLFGELLQVNLPTIAGLFAAATAAERDAVADALAEITNAAEVLEFAALKDTLAVLADLVGGGIPREPGPARAALVRAVAELVLNVRVVEEIAAVSGAASLLTAAATDALGEDIRLALATLAHGAGEVEQACQAGLPPPAASLAASLVTLAGSVDAVADLMLCIGADRAGDLLALLRDACLRLEGRADGGAARGAALIAGAARRLAAEDLAGDALAAPIAELRQLLSGAGDASPSHIAGIDVGADMRDHLDGDSIERLRRSLEAGETAYRWSLFLEDAQETANTIIGWISQAAHPIHSRTLIRDGKSWFEFLLAAPIPAGDVPALLVRLDPGGVCIRKVVALDATPQGVTILDETTARPVEREDADAVPSSTAEARYFRVRGEAVDGLIGALGTLRSRLSDLAEIVGSQKGRDAAPRGLSALATPVPAHDDAPADHGAADHGATDQGAAMLRSLEQLAEKIEADAYNLQVVPLDHVFRRLPRIVHALGQQQDKAVQLAVDHGGIRVDKAIIDLLLEPLVHLITNAVDHGIEGREERAAAGKPPSAVVGVQARRAGGELVLTIRDDGRGMDEDAIRRTALARGLVGEEALATLTGKDVFRLTLQPGFSTAAKLTNTSGRGVGLDVVATTIRRLDGFIDIDSAAGLGTTFRLRLPLSRSLQSLVLAEAAGQVYAFNERSVVRLMLAEVQGAGDGSETVEVQPGERTRVLPLTELLWHPAAAARCAPSGEQPIVVIGNEHDVLGIRVARIVGRRNMALRASGPFLLASKVVAGASTLVNGSVVLLLDAQELLAVAREGRWRSIPAST